MKRVIAQGLTLGAVALVAALLVGTGVGFFIAGLYLHLSFEVGRVAATMWTGGIVIGAAVVVAAIAVLILRRPRGAASGVATANGGNRTASAVAQGLHWVEEHPMAAAAAALSAGVIVGKSDAARDLILSVVKELSRRPS